jgi:hypothetical protein
MQKQIINFDIFRSLLQNIIIKYKIVYISILLNYKII